MPRTAIGSMRQLVRNFGTCLSFAGGADRITFTVPTSMNPANLTALTCAFWINPSSINNNSAPRIIDPDTAGAGIQILFTSSTLSCAVLHSVGGASAIFPAGAIKIGQWQRVLMTWSDADNVPLIYLNGALVTPGSTSNKSGSRNNWAGATAYIGNRSANDRGFAGKMDEFTIWNRVLTAQEISDDFYKGPPNTPLLRYKLDEGSGTTATDSGSAGVNGTIATATYSTDVFIRPRTVGGSSFPGISNCVGWWRCRQADFGTTTLTNEISGGQNFTLTSPLWRVIGGRNCLEMAGAANASSYGRLTIGSSDLLNLSGATSFTRLALVISRGSGGNGNGRVIASPGQDFIVRGNDTNNSLGLAAGGSNTTFSYTSISYAQGFQVIAEVYNGSAGTRQLIVNGVNRGTPVSTASSSMNSGLTGLCELGAQNNGGNASQFNGYIAEVALFKNRVMTAQETYDFFFARRPLESGTSRTAA